MGARPLARLLDYYNRIIRAISGRGSFCTRWAMESRLHWMEMQAEAGQILYYECGTVILATAGHCDWEDATAETFDKVGVPYHKFTQADVSARFPQFDCSSIAYALYEPQSGMVMAHRAVLAGVELFKRAGGTVRRGRVTTDADERLMLDGRPLEADLVVVATGPWMADMYPKTIKPISQIVALNVLYTSTPDGSTAFDHTDMPYWIDHGEGSFGLPSVEGGGGHPRQDRPRQ
ncbi:MAG: FAD-dependent oxidoreductase [Pseudomonadota bacterium]